ncbi:uncharacterized protein C8Q71DRAFT_906472 [Rhodofomes roseus]|uniref:Transmembrane protein n=1 Tax=Rhodofomes roseus TaxID=34475 RepID=A0ABQ8KM91_9APHY|nr:uncharacterized protein C8Q71DRAFT_906472 [Rhodofomes roseus]KAH9838707.1 hypothetical protein C8Q71DRAFT_906472 [Rhodofomes roseus]
MGITPSSLMDDEAAFVGWMEAAGIIRSRADNYVWGPAGYQMTPPHSFSAGPNTFAPTVPSGSTQPNGMPTPPPHQLQTTNAPGHVSIPLPRLSLSQELEDPKPPSSASDGLAVPGPNPIHPAEPPPLVGPPHGHFVPGHNPYLLPSGEPLYFAGASPHGAPYANGAAATGFALGTPYQVHYASQGNPRPAVGGQLQGVRVDEESALQLHAVRAYRGSRSHIMTFDRTWDDERLLKEMRKTYDGLRSWRRWLSLKNVRSVTLVSIRGKDQFIFPQRIGPSRVSARQHMRLRFLLDHPEKLRGSRDFMKMLDAPGVGIEFVERWQAKRLAFAVIGLVLLSLAASLIYACVTGDVSTAFTIGSYITSAFSVVLVLVGILGFVDL